MPKEIFTEEEFLKYSEHAIHCRVKRIKDIVKLKLRTRRCLYTFKTDPTRRHNCKATDKRTCRYGPQGFRNS